MSNRFQYQARTSEDLKKREEQTGGGFIGFLVDAVSRYERKNGENCIRILPPTWQNAKHYGLEIWVHYDVGPQGAAVLCNLRMYGEKCASCEASSHADAAGKEDEAKAYRATKRVLVWLLDRKEQESEKTKPLAWAVPWTLDRDVAKLCRDRRTGELYQIDHPDNGYDIFFDYEEKERKYSGLQLARQPSPVNEKHLDYIMEHPLPSILIKRTYQEVKSLLEGGSEIQETAPEPQQPQRPQQQEPPQTNWGGMPVSNSAPWEQSPQQQPQPMQRAVAYCEVGISYRGEKLACGLALGHNGEHDFSRNIAPQQQQPVQQQPISQQVPQPMQPQTQAAEAPQSRAAAMRERFQNR